jgi:hypothetical protein
MPHFPAAGRRLTLVMTLGGLLLSVALAGARDRKGGADKEQPDGERNRATLKLRATVQAGFAPLSITFTSRLRDVSTDDPTFCHAGIFLRLKLSSGEFATLAGEDPACVHSADERHVRLTFSHRYVVPREGLYEFYSVVRTQDGREIISNGVPVRVLSSPAGG